MCLGMTHEEVIAWLASREIRSYRDLPQTWYQIQTKERDEARPKSGVLRTREFVMKDSYSLDRDVAGLEVQYEAHRQAYCRIYDRCGVQYVVVESDPGMMGGAGSHEFMAPSPAGEDRVALCATCGYAANVELAVARAPLPDFPAWTLEEVATPNARTIAEVCAFLKIEPALTIKSLVVVAKDGPGPGAGAGRSPAARAEAPAGAGRVPARPPGGDRGGDGGRGGLRGAGGPRASA